MSEAENIELELEAAKYRYLTLKDYFANRIVELSLEVGATDMAIKDTKK